MAPTNGSKARKPSKVVKPTKSKKKSTISTKNHRFQPFSQRVANLKIDPIRRRRKPEDREKLGDDTESYFGRSLTEWRDLNLSTTFTAFAKEAAPLCDSLPVVLHNEEKIIDLLVTYIGRADALALEALLSLLSHFAHDLDSRFEKHFQRAVTTVASVAAKHPDPAVVEWSFNCLAWLFKYLSRLLTPDLRPLYDLMAPYLGKQPQKPFIIRFAAESMSFLVRKAAARYQNDQEPLDFFVSHVFQDCQNEANITSRSLLEQGISTLFTESITGIQSDIHSSGLYILQSILNHAEQSPTDQGAMIISIVKGTLTSLIHSADADTFRPVQDTIASFSEDREALWRPSRIKLAAELILTITAVRKGTRISDWPRIINLLQTIIHATEKVQNLDKSTSHSVLAAVAIGFQSATLDAVLPALNVFEILRTGEMAPYFLQFCDLFSRLDQAKFQNLLLPQFQKFILEQFAGAEDEIFLGLSNLAVHGKKLSCPDGLQDELIRRCCGLTKKRGVVAPEEVYRANRALAAIPYLRLKDSVEDKLQTGLSLLIRQSLDGSGSDVVDRFACGAAFDVLLIEADWNDIPSTLWPSLCSASHRFIEVEAFWSNFLRYSELSTASLESVDLSHVGILKESLLQCLSMPSHSVRQSALRLIRTLYQLQGHQIPSIIDVAISIESTPVSFETSRSISMNIRRLASGYSTLEDDEFLRKAVPTYCFGLLHLQLSQAWDEAINALSEMSKSPVAEEVITNMVQSWLEPCEGLSLSEHNVVDASAPIFDSDSKGFQVASDFECSNFAKVDAICQQVFEAPRSGYLSAQDHFQSKHPQVPRIPNEARGKALRVLNQIPSLAEKRSRMPVSFLLRWAGNAPSHTDSEVSRTEAMWNRKDQKSLLGVFAQFTNPKVLFKASEAYDALLNLCSNGDVEIQRSALKALLTWKKPAVTKHAEHLTNLLDEARFSEELSVFLQDIGEDGGTAIDPDDHAQLMPVLLRMLYGRAVAASKSEQGSRRKAIFVALSSYKQDILGMFMDITMQSIHGIELVNNGVLDEKSLSLLKTPLRQQLGMFNMLDDMLETLGSQLEPVGIRVLNALALCSVAASRKMDNRHNTQDLQSLSLLRSIRQTGIQALAKAFTAFSDLDLAVYAKVAANELIAPRLEKFASENTQSISGILRLLAALVSSKSGDEYLLESRKDTIDAVALLLGDPHVKDEVRIFVLQEIVDKLVRADSGTHLDGSQIAGLVRSLGHILEQAPAKYVLDACVISFTQLSGYVNRQDQAETIITVCSGLLVKPNKVVSNATKSGLLKTILPLLELSKSSFYQELYNAVCGLFSRFHERDSRVLLSTVLIRLCGGDERLLEAAYVCQDLNAIGSKLDEPDHARREAAFSKIYEKFKDFCVQQWMGIVHNCLYYIRDGDDLVNRTSASRALERFIDAASLASNDFKYLLSSAVLPGIFRGVKDPFELVRAEYVSLIGHFVEQMPTWSAVRDMANLTAGGDGEASFFTNVLHIQQHRRLRALRRLTDETDRISAHNATQLFFPLLEHFVFEPSPGDAGRTLADQTISTLGALSKALNWSAFRTTFRRYVGLLGSETHEKVVLRLLNSLVEGSSAEKIVDTGSTIEASSSHTLGQNELDQRSAAIVRDMLTPLTDYLHHKDESTVDRRMPVALTVVRILKWLPEGVFSSRLPSVLTDVCHVLRSRSQEARDQTRKTLCQIVTLVGPTYFGFVLKELRGALQRGYQLHVLSFTVHALLVSSVEGYQPGDLNSCLPDLVSIVMDDIFGVTGQEKDAEDYKSSMKEVKSSKSFDTMEILAKVTPVRQLALLIKPLQALLSEKLSTKALMKIDDLFTRLRKGVDRNPAARSMEILMFCHEIVTNSRKDFNRSIISTSKKDIHPESSASRAYAFRVVSFAFDLLRKTLRKHEDLATAANLAGFIPVLSDALVEGQQEVQLSALKLIATIMKVPLRDLDSNAPVYVAEAVRHVRAATNMTTDAAKAGLELVTAVLRDRPVAQVRDKDLADILSALKGSIDEPDRQGIVYKFLRALLGRNIMLTEVYEVMDEVGRVMVTNADRAVRESARGAYLQFMLEYPQTTKRWKKQSERLVENLQYPHSAGRQSVMELIYQLLNKCPHEMFSKLASKIFLPLVLVQNSDEDDACREMARLLLGKLFEAADDDQVKDWLALLDKWLQNETGGQIQIASLQCWTIVLRARIPSEKRLATLRDRISDLLHADDNEEPMVNEQVTEEALRTFESLAHFAPSIAFSQYTETIWKSLDAMLSSEIAARLLGAYFAHLASSSSKAGRGLSALPLVGSDGLQLTGDDMLRKCSASLRLLAEGPEVLTEELKEQIVRNLVFLGRCFAANGLERRVSKREKDLEDDVYRSALGYLFGRLSYIIRQENIEASRRGAAIDCQLALTNVVEIVPNITTVLRPLYTLTDASVPHSDTGLADKARELMDLLQKRSGKDSYIQALGIVQTEAKGRRAERRTKRKIDMVTRPGKRMKVK